MENTKSIKRFTKMTCSLKGTYHCAGCTVDCNWYSGSSEFSVPANYKLIKTDKVQEFFCPVYKTDSKVCLECDAPDTMCHTKAMVLKRQSYLEKKPSLV